MKNQGLTLIELLIVLAIVGLGWFTLLPRLDIAGDRNQNQLEKVNALLLQAGQEALWTNSLQQINLSMGQDTVIWQEQEQTLPAALSSAEVNGRRATSRQLAFFIYPGGHMDEVRLLLQNGQQLKARPVANKLRLE